MTIGYDVTGGINNETGTERNTLGRVSRPLRKEMSLAAGALLLKKAAQKLVERGVGKSRRGRQFRLFGHGSGIGPARQRYIYQRGGDFFDQGRKALVQD